MSKKTDVIRLHEEGKDYHDIEKETGTDRRYIGQIVRQYRKDNAPTELVTETGEPGETEPLEVTIDDDEMHFENDLEGKDNMAGGKMEDAKTGRQFHEAWVKERAFECACGCTLNRKSTYCPNCGTALNWEGF